MSGTSANKHARPRAVSARARLRSKSQLTLPEEIRRALLVNEGDEVEFQVEENGRITVRGYISVPTEHAWLYAAQQSARQSAGQVLSAAPPRTMESVDALFGHLETLGAADD